MEVEILEVERVLPEVDANDRDTCKMRVLVGRRHDFECFRLAKAGIEALGAIAHYGT